MSVVRQHSAPKFDEKSVLLRRSSPQARCQTPTLTLAGSRVSLQSRPSPDGSSVDGISPVEKKKKMRPSSAVPASNRTRETPSQKSPKSNARKSPLRRPQSALISSPTLRRKESDNASDTTSSVNVFKVTVRDAKINKRTTPAPCVPDWSSEMSSEISLGGKIEALARKNTVEFIDALDEVEEFTPAATRAVLDRSAKDDLAFCASFLPASAGMASKQHYGLAASSRRKSDSVLAFKSASDTGNKHMDRVQEWIEEIQALDDEERRLELKEAEAADALTVMSLEEELFVSGKNKKSAPAVEACVGTEDSFDDDLDGIQELIERCKRSDEFNMSDTTKKDQLSDNYYSILETLELLDVKDRSDDSEFDLREKLTSAAGFPSKDSPLPEPVPGKRSPYSFRGTLPASSGAELEKILSLDVEDNLKSSPPAAGTPTRSSVLSFRDSVCQNSTSASALDGRMDVGSKTGEIFALLDQHAGLEPITKTPTAKPSFNNHYAGDYIDALGKISMMELEMREKSNIIEDLKSTIAEQRELLASNTKNANRELRQKTEVQKKDYEETIKRHLNMIDQLIAEKRGLADRCERLGEDMKQMDKRHKDTINSIEERHAAELRRIRSVQSSAEKLKRDKWIDEKTKEIKEMTVKGLEPEIQRILERHKAELEGVRAGHKAELKEVERRVKAEMTQEIERLKVEFQREKEMACMSEREIARQRLEKQFEEEEKLLQERRLKLLKQAEDEREKWERLVTKTRDEAQMQLQSQRQKFELELFQLREMLTKEEEKRVKEKDELVANLTKEIEAEKSRLNSNFEASVDQAIKVRARDLEAEREKQMDELRKEHLLEIEKLRSELGSEFESKLRRMRDKYSVEMEELENQEKAIHGKYFSAKSELTQVQEEAIKYKTSSNQYERELEAVSKELNVLQEERKNMWTAIGTQFEGKISALEDENRKMRLDLSEVRELLAREKRARENDRETLKKEKEDEMEQVFKRVKFALDKKEESMSQLKQEYQEVLLRNQQLQSLLEKQCSNSVSSGSSNRFRKLPSSSKHPGKS